MALKGIKDLEELNPLTDDVERFKNFYLNNLFLYIPPSVQIREISLSGGENESCLVYPVKPPQILFYADDFDFWAAVGNTKGRPIIC